jgi:hypothetical protein
MRFFIVLVFIFQTLRVEGQVLKTAALDFSLGMNRIDFFTTINYSKNSSANFKYSASVGLGVNRTFFQRRLFPRFGLEIQYAFFERPCFSLSPLFSLNYSVLRILNAQLYFNQWIEAYVGLQWELGKGKVRFIQSNALGLMHERFPNEGKPAQKQGYNSFGFFTNIGLKYVF